MLAYISQLKSIDTNILNTVVSELQSITIDWNEPYPEYASDGLKVATLLNPTGEQNNFDYHDCQKPITTPLLNQLPALAAFLQNSGLQIMGSRLLRLDPGTFLHEHRDFVYLKDIARLRLHLPLITNNNAFITAPGINVHFKHGYLWKLDPKATVHSACNFGAEPRIHLMLDCYNNQALSDLVKTEKLDNDCIFQLPNFSPADKDRLFAEAQQHLNGERLKEAEETLLRTFCQFNLQNITSYDLLFEFFAKNPDHAGRIDYWKARLKEVYLDRKMDGVPELIGV